MTDDRPTVFAGRPTGTAVTARDLGSGESETVEIVNDYVVVTDGTCEVAGVQVHANGTHVITVKGAHRG